MLTNTFSAIISKARYGLFISAMVLCTLTQAATQEEDITVYINIFKADKSLHSDAADTLAWKGLSDPRLFDLIEQRLLADAAAAEQDRHEKNRVARYIRALGFSGQAKYIPTIESYVKNRTYHRYAEAALKDQVNYQKWDSIISNRANFNPKYSDDTNRVLNMLHSDDIFLQRIGAKRAFFGERDPAILELLAKLIQANLPRTATPDQEYLDTYAWMVKGLGSSGDPQYQALIIEVAKTTRSFFVERHAKESLQKHYQMTLK